ncbi:hypothetical protein [Vibrio phage vB_VcM_SY]
MENMTTTENKYMILARIAMLLRRKGLHVSLYSDGVNSEYISMGVYYFSDGDCTFIEDLDARKATEQELLDWWSAIKG